MKILILLSFLPYIKTSPLNTDIQPHVIALLLVLLFYIALTKKTIPISPFTLVGSILMLPIGLILNAGTTTVSLVLAPIFIDFLSRRSKNEFLWAAKMAVIIYYIGLAINILAPELLYQLVANFRTSSLRGFNSFTSEPSYLGLVGLALTIVLATFNAGKHWVLLAAILVFASGSATAIIPLGVYLGVSTIRGKLIILTPLVFGGLWILIILIAASDSRLGILVNTFLSSPELILLDQSVSNRIFRSFGPIISASTDFFMPHDFSKNISLNIGNLSEQTDAEISRLSSLATIFIYGLGWLSLPFILVYGWIARAPISIWIVIIYLSITNITFATPYLWVVLAIPLQNARQTKSKTVPKSNRTEPPKSSLVRSQ